MYIFGCLPFLLILIAFVVAAQVLRLAGRTLETVGATVVWLWESLLNLFRIEKKEVINPFSGESNFDHTRQDADLTYTPTETRPKRYDASDGETIPYQEL